MKYIIFFIAFIFSPFVHAGGSGSLMTDAKLVGNVLTFRDFSSVENRWMHDFPECKNKIIRLEIKNSLIFILKNKLLNRSGAFSDLDEIEKSIIHIKNLNPHDTFSLTVMGSSVKKIADCNYVTYSLISYVGSNKNLSLTTYLSF